MLSGTRTGATTEGPGEFPHRRSRATAACRAGHALLNTLAAGHGSIFPFGRRAGQQCNFLN
ncbi:protein of unknown function [Streptomyces sp. KY70]|nr:protein of unknown function [Streptomyces sp. KY70]